MKQISLTECSYSFIFFVFFSPTPYLLADLVDWIFAICRRTKEFHYDYKRTDLLGNPQHLIKMWLTDKFCPSWPPGYVTAERFERVCF